MKGKINKPNKILLALVAVLTLAVAVQGYFLLTHREAPFPEQTFAAETFPDMSPQLLTPDPIKDFEKMRREMERRFFESSPWAKEFSNFPSLPGDKEFSPRVDINENAKAYVVRVNIPGAKDSKIDVSVHDGLLTISGTVEKSLEEKKQDRILRQERFTGHFERSLTLPGPVVENQMQTRYDDGVLVVTLPKAPV